MIIGYILVLFVLNTGSVDFAVNKNKFSDMPVLLGHSDDY